MTRTEVELNLKFVKAFKNDEEKAEENCKIYLCRECNIIFECDGNVALCSKARTFC